MIIKSIFGFFEAWKNHYLYRVWLGISDVFSLFFPFISSLLDIEKKRRFHYTHSYFWIMKRSTVDGLKMAGSYYLPFIWFCSFFCKPIFIFSELWERAYFSNIYGVWFLVKDFFRLIWLDFCWTLLLYLFIQYYIKNIFFV